MAVGRVGRVGLVDPVELMELTDGDLAEFSLCYDTWRGDGVFNENGLGSRSLKRVKKGFFISRRETYFGAR